MIAARLHAVGDLRVADEPAARRAAAGVVPARGHLGGHLRVRPALVHRRRHRGEPHRAPRRAWARVRGRRRHRAVCRAPGRRRPGDPVPSRARLCRMGYQNLCPTVQFAGHGTLDGALQEQLRLAGSPAAPAARRLSDDAGALLEPLGVAIHAVGREPSAARRGRPGGRRRTRSVRWRSRWPAARAPPGCSPSNPSSTGGRPRFAVEPTPRARTSDGAEEVLDATGGSGVDVVVEIAGTDAAIATAVAASRPGARVALAGIPSEDDSSFPAAPARRKGLTFAMVRRMNDTYPRAIALAADGYRPGPAGHRASSR